MSVEADREVYGVGGGRLARRFRVDRVRRVREARRYIEHVAGCEDAVNQRLGHLCERERIVRLAAALG